MRIAHLVSAGEAGGILSVVTTLASYQARNGHEVWACSLSGRALDSLLLDERVTALGFGIRGPWDVLAIARLFRFLRETRLDVLHCHPGTLGRVLGLLAGVPRIVATYHGTWAEAGTVVRQVHRWLAGRTSVLVANSNYVRGYFASALLVRETRLRLVYNGVDSAWFSGAQEGPEGSTRRSLRIPEEGRVIAWTGRLHPDKGIETLIEAAPTVVQRVPSAFFVIVGTGKHQSALEATAERVGMSDRVVFAGSQRDVRSTLAVAEVFAYPSLRREGFGLAVVEAMAAGVPVVASDCGGICEVVESGETGLLVEAGDSEALAAAIVELLEDHSLSRLLSRHAAEAVARRFDARRMCEAYERLYSSSE